MVENRFLIIASGHNVEKYVEGCIASVSNQNYNNFNAIFMDDGSTDNTYNAINIFKINRGSNLFSCRGIMNVGLVKCRHNCFHKEFMDATQPDIIVWLDLDDELMPNALEVLNVAYQDPNVWLTYGGYQNSFGEIYKGSQYKLMPDIAAREQDWKFIPLRSFRRELYDQLSDKDLFPAISEVYPDANMLYCMMEMAGHDHCKPIDEVLYRYNCSNPLNVTKRFPESQRDAELAFIKSLTPKQKLNKL